MVHKLGLGQGGNFNKTTPFPFFQNKIITYPWHSSFSMRGEEWRGLKAEYRAVTLRLLWLWLIRVLVKMNPTCTLTRPVDLLAHFLWLQASALLPGTPRAPVHWQLLHLRSLQGAPPARRAATSAALEAVSVPSLSAEGPWTSTAALPSQGEPAPSASREPPHKSAFYCFYTTWSCATFLLLWNMWIVRKVELKITHWTFRFRFGVELPEMPHC